MYFVLNAVRHIALLYMGGQTNGTGRYGMLRAVVADGVEVSMQTMLQVRYRLLESASCYGVAYPGTLDGLTGTG